MVPRGITANGRRSAACRRDGLGALPYDGRIEAATPPDRTHGMPTLIPALLRPYCDLGAIRHDYPVVLIQDGSGETVAPLADVLDDLLGRIDPADADVEVLRRELYRLETRIKRRADHRPGALLSTLWRQAAGELVEGISDPARREAVGRELATAFEAIGRDGPLVTCRSDAARQLVEHVWHRIRSEQAIGHAEILDELIVRIADAIDAERARAPESVSPAGLQASLGDQRGGIDYEALSTLLFSAGRHERTAGERPRRLREPLRVIESERDRLHEEAAAHRAPSGSTGAAAHESCATALGAWRSDMLRRVRLLRSIRLATLELGSRVRPDGRGPTFSDAAPEHLSPEARRALPPLLLYLDADDVAATEWTSLLDLLASDVPIKVLLAVHETPGGPPARPEGAAAWPEGAAAWPERLAEMALLLGEIFVVQTAASHLPRLAGSVAAALRYEGPALLSVFVGPPDTSASIPTYTRCAAAVESRALPSFVYDPQGGTEWSDRFSLAGSPQAELVWPRHRLAWEDADGRTVEEDLAFTAIDLLVLDPRLRRHFGLVPRSAWNARLLPVAEYLALPATEAANKLPYVHVVDGSDRLYRAVVSRDLVAAARACAANWAKLQGLARPSAGPVDGPPPAALEGLSESSSAGPLPATPAAESTVSPEGPPGPSTGPRPEEIAPSPDVATIDTALCTTCDECTARNPRMFAYNETKQAFISDVRAGTYRELVEAAENCPVCIIHPGKPLDMNEPGLDELVARAAPFLA